MAKEEKKNSSKNSSKDKSKNSKKSSSKGQSKNSSKDKSKNTSKDKSKNSKKNLSKNSKSNRIPVVKTKLKGDLAEKCKKGPQCLFKLEDFDHSLEDIYDNVDKFGFTIELPNETPFSRKSYKPKCKSVKGKVNYEEPEINKKSFGFLMPKLNSSLYVGKQQNHICYDPQAKDKERSQLEIGQTCYNDKECKSEKCSNIKFFKLPGKCVPAPSIDTRFEGEKCSSNDDCRHNLECIDKICKKKSKTVKDAIKEKRSKKKGGIKQKIYDYTPSVFKRNNSSKGITKNTVKNDFFSPTDKEIDSILSDDRFYFDDKNKHHESYCKNDNDCKYLDSDMFCHKNSCKAIHKRCDISKVMDCYRNKKYVDEGTDCCEEDSRCTIYNNDGVDQQICVHNSKLKKKKNQNICLKDEDCLSNYCSRKMNLCIPEPINNNKLAKYCSKTSDCKRGLYARDDLICDTKRKICALPKYIEKKSLNIGDVCTEHDQCISNKCGMGVAKDGKENHKSKKILSDKICIPRNIQEKMKFLEESLIKDKKDLEKSNKSIKKSINKMKSIIEGNNDTFIIYAKDNAPNKLAIIRRNDYLYLGKIIEQYYNREGTYEKVISILYFHHSAEGKFDNFKNSIMLITENKDNSFYNFFKNTNRINNVTIMNISKSKINIVIDNQFLFSYLCHLLFGKRIHVYNPSIEKNTKEENSYFTIDELYLSKLKDKNYSESIKLGYSIPFIKDNSNLNINRKYLPVYKKYSNIKSILNDYVKKVEKSQYHEYNKLSYFYVKNDLFFDFQKIGSELIIFKNKSSINKSENKPLIKYDNINKYCIFSDVINYY